jgi:hypothetical protein
VQGWLFARSLTNNPVFADAAPTPKTTIKAAADNIFLKFFIFSPQVSKI